MSVPVSPDEIQAAAADYGESAFILVSSSEGPPRVTHALVAFEGGEIVATVGRRAGEALAANPAVSVLWPATAAQSMSLIVDGTAAAPQGAEGGEIRITPTGAVRHRPAAG